MTFQAWPAVDLLDGNVARLHQGRYDEVKSYRDRPRDLFALLADHGLRRLHLVDLSGARTGAFTAYDALSAAADAGFQVEVGGGFRAAADVARALSAGAARVVLGTRLVESEEFAAEVVARFGPNRVVAGLDVRDGRLSLSGWLREGPEPLPIWGRLRELGFTLANVTDISRDGSLKGLSRRFWTAWAEVEGDIGAGGGIASLDDLRLCRDLGLSRAVIGKAWLEGRIPLDAPEWGDRS